MLAHHLDIRHESLAPRAGPRGTCGYLINRVNCFLLLLFDGLLEVLLLLLLLRSDLLEHRDEARLAEESTDTFLLSTVGLAAMTASDEYQVTLRLDEVVVF